MPTCEKHLQFIVPTYMEGKRLDLCVCCGIENLSRSIFSDKRTRILLDGKEVKKSRLVKTGQTIEVFWVEEYFDSLIPQDIPLDILYEDEDVLVINKSQGMVVHPAAGNYENTLVNALLFRYGMQFSTFDEEDEDFESLVQEVRPGIVHRLDKDTSGVLVVAKNAISHRNLSEQFKMRTTKKVYIALAKGRFSEKQGSIRANLKRDPKDRKKFVTCAPEEGRDAWTDYTVLRQYADFALLRITLHTGRTHQIRVHLKSIGHPIVGDPLYGKPDGHTLMLHALLLEFESPTSKRRICCRAPMPDRFRLTLHPASARVRSGSSPVPTDRG